MLHLKSFLAMSLASLSLLAPFAAHADVLTFDTLPNNPFTPISNYDGFNFSNFYVINGSSYPGTGYMTGVTSSPNVALNGFSLPASFSLASPGVFTLNSFELTAAHFNGDVVTIIGTKDGIQLYAATYVVGTSGPTLETPNFVGIDTLTLVSTDQAVLDDITVNGSVVTPEPGTVTLVGTGILSLVGVARRKFTA